MQIKIISFTDDAVLKIASAAAITRGKDVDWVQRAGREYQERLIKHCYESGHWSIFEFADVDIEIQGASRVFETQLVRNRTGVSYCIESGRHNQTYEIADAVLEHMDTYIAESVRDGIDEYDWLIEHAKRAEEARYALPQGVARKIRVKYNFRSLMNMMQVRLCSHTQREYRAFAIRVKSSIREHSEFLSEFLQPKCEVVGYCNEKNQCKPWIPSKKVVDKLIEDWRDS